MISTEVKIADWALTPEWLRVTVEVMALDGHRASFYLRKGYEGLGWYCNDTQGAKPDQRELAPLLNALVEDHPVLGSYDVFDIL